ncbi:MAG: NUDIX domain-containing protein [Candidatus Thorarchaeota archaeon]
MSNERFELSATVHLVLIENKRILMQRRYNTGFEDGNYSLIAGHINGNETFREAMVREAKEEAGIFIHTDDLQVIHLLHRKKPIEKIDTFLYTTKWLGTPTIIETDKADDLHWFDLDNLPENTVEYIRWAINQIAKKIFYSEFGW